MPVRVAVFGAGGKMGSTVCDAVLRDGELELVAAVDPMHAGLDVSKFTEGDARGLQISSSADALREAGAEVAVDFTVLDGARDNLAWCAANGVHAVVGTTGFTDDDLERFRSTFTNSNCLIAPNFAIGAVMMMRFAELAAPWFETAEIIELHHDQKIDAPSGTALRTAALMAAASADWGPDPTKKLVVDGARGAQAASGIRVHSVRLKGLVAHQEVLLGTEGQSLSIRHDSFDRSSFMPGVVLACKHIAEHAGVTVGLEPFLGL
jgi:4-hydroxy-tetrahydrodipicolinate reductase